MTPNLSPDTDTATVRPIATFMQRAQRVWGVNEFLKQLSNHRSVKGTELHEDAKRFNALVRTNAVLLWHLHNCATNVSYAHTFLHVNSPARVKSQIRNFSNIHRLSFVTLGNFFLENMLRGLVADFGKKPKKNFHELCEQAVHLAQLPDPGDHINRLRIVSLLRNTLHSRGIHAGYKGKNTRLTVKGVVYQFNHGDIVKGHASWDHICHGFASALTTVSEIVEKARPRRAT